MISATVINVFTIRDDADAVYVTNEDGGGHTKWLNFIAPRLYMLWQLLNDDRGVLFVSINDVELFRLGCCSTKFLGKRIGSVLSFGTAPQITKSRWIVPASILFALCRPGTLHRCRSRTLPSSRVGIVNRNRLSDLRSRREICRFCGSFVPSATLLPCLNPLGLVGSTCCLVTGSGGRSDRAVTTSLADRRLDQLAFDGICLSLPR
jgi:hypothetical protein